MKRMNEWPAWQRWGIWLLGWALYLGAFSGLFLTENLVLRIVALVVLCAGLLVLSYSGRAIMNERLRKVDRWYLRVTLPAFLVYIVLMLYVFPREAQIATPWLKAVVTLLPVLPLVFVAWALVRFINRCDEMVRRQHLEAAGIAVVVVSLVSMALGFLGAAKLIVLNGSVVLLMVLPALCLVYGFGCAWAQWRNRAR